MGTKGHSPEPLETECRQSTNRSPSQTFVAELVAQGSCIDRVVNEKIPLESVLVKKSYFAVKIPSDESGTNESIMDRYEILAHLTRYSI